MSDPMTLEKTMALLKNWRDPMSSAALHWLTTLKAENEQFRALNAWRAVECDRLAEQIRNLRAALILARGDLEGYAYRVARDVLKETEPSE